MYEVYYSKTAIKQTKHLKAAKLDKKCKELIGIIEQNPYQIPPPYEKLIGDLYGNYSRRINGQHRLGAGADGDLGPGQAFHVSQAQDFPVAGIGNGGNKFFDGCQFFLPS